MPKQLAEAQTKLETVERQLETAKTEVTKPFMQAAGTDRTDTEKAKRKEETL